MTANITWLQNLFPWATPTELVLISLIFVLFAATLTWWLADPFESVKKDGNDE